MECDTFIWLNLDFQYIRFSFCLRLIESTFFEFYSNLSCLIFQGFASQKIKRYTFPSFIVNKHLCGYEGFSLRVLRNFILLCVTPVLTKYQLVRNNIRLKWLQLFKYFYFFISNIISFQGFWWLHGSN